METSGFLPKIKVHTWGGLGSQLYAIALAIDLQDRFLNRRFEYVSHSGGVTKREPAIQFYSKKIRVINDFNKITIHAKDDRKNTVLIYSKKLLYLSGILAKCNDDIDTSKLKPWVLFIRGHYSSRKVSLTSAKNIFEKINNECQSEDGINIYREITCHYRLGDLEQLSEKSSISSRVLGNTIETVSESISAKTIYLYSDSTDLAKSKLLKESAKLDIVTNEVSPLKTIHECLHSDIFVGTNSKISIWIAILRATKNEKYTSYLPTEIKKMIIGFEGSFMSKSIKFY